LCLADYFQIAGAWMKGQFNVEPDVDEGYWKERYTYSDERWNRWKLRLMAIRDAAKRDDVRENANAAVKAMEN